MNKTDKPIRGDEPFPIPYRDPLTIERIVGKIRKAVQLGTGFYDWPLWKRYPTWHQYNQQIADEREAAAKAARPAHRSAAPPSRQPASMQTEDSVRNDMMRNDPTRGGWRKRAPRV